MNGNDIEFIDFWQQFIKDEIQKGVRGLQFVKAYPAKVVSVDGLLANVTIAGDTNIITGLKNKTHETLIIGDEVYLFSPTNNLSNLFIAIKF